MENTVMFSKHVYCAVNVLTCVYLIRYIFALEESSVIDRVILIQETYLKLCD